MDERTVAELLRDVADDAPEATFDEADIARRSRAQDRRRRRIAGVGALAGVIMVCAGVAVGLGLGHTGEGRTGRPAIAAGGTSTGTNTLRARTPGPASARALPVGPSLQGDGSTGAVGPPRGCRRADGELAAALADELPSAATPRTPAFSCPDGSRFAGYATGDGVAGVLLVTATPGTDPLATAPRGTTSVAVRTASGATLYLTDQPVGRAAATPPAELRRMAERIAARF